MARADYRVPPLEIPIPNYFTRMHLIAKPEAIQFAPALPKTRSGKIMRRILRKVAEGHTEDLGDTTTLADPGVVDNLVERRQA